MNNITNYCDCTGCGLCQNICPAKCINMVYNKEGFLHPETDITKCIDCHLCEKVCISNHSLIKSNKIHSLYSVISNDKNNLSHCTSGGFFGEACKSVIENHKGIVYGAVSEKPYLVKHMRALTLEETLPMHYSKYEQSDTTGTYISVKKDLDDNRFVLFTGTPCQIMALRTFLKKEYSNLLCVDVLCFGVMSSYVLRDYINYVLPENHRIDEINVCFRSKEIPGCNASFVIKNGNDILYHESFYKAKVGIGKGFGGGFTNRISCSNCQFQALERYSDITIGDYVKEKSENDLSHSLVLINTEKGKKFFETLDLNFAELQGEEKDFSLKRVCRKTPRNAHRDKFFKLYFKYGITEKTTAIWETSSLSLKYRVKAKLIKIIKKQKNSE